MINDYNEKLVYDTFNCEYNEEQFKHFITDLLGNNDFNNQNRLVPNEYTDFIKSYKVLCKYEYIDPEYSSLKVIDVLVVKLKKTSSIERARTAQRNFVARYLNGGHGYQKDAALVAFISENENGKISPDWRFSFVQMNYKTEIVDTEDGKKKLNTKVELTPAKRFSFLVGENENTHTAQKQFYDCLVKSSKGEKITIEDLVQAFDIETISDKFFEEYKKLYQKLVDELKRLYKSNKNISNDFDNHKIDIDDFAKKTLGQLVFLYFIQKKGWLGVEKNKDWGSGDKKFLRNVFENKGKYKNFFNDILEPLFYEALAKDRTDKDDLFEPLNCRIPFLNGGLFEPLNGYEWTKTDLTIDNNIFKEVFDTFDLYNFTVKEDEPLEKEVAVDPEMLGKVFEKLLPENIKKNSGSFYTPREIVHYMCQESLINYLYNRINLKEVVLNKEKQKSQLQLIKIEKPSEQLELTHEVVDEIVSKEDIAEFIKTGTSTYTNKTRKISVGLPESVKKYATELDKALSEVKVCDPAIGSGAFPVGMMNEIVRARTALSEYLGEKDRSMYSLKSNTIQNSIYGVDIAPGAVEIAKLRFWLSLVVDEEDVKKIRPLPNLDYKIVCGDSLLRIERTVFNDEKFLKLEELKSKHFDESNTNEKCKLKKEIDEIINELTKDGTFDFEVYFSEIFHKKDGINGFDIVIGNPPYVSNKGTTVEQKKLYTKIYGISDDLYNYFFDKSINDLLKRNGTIAFITSDTYLTINSKINLRKLFQENKIIELIKTDNVFEDAMVSPAILILQKQDTANIDYKFIFKDAINDFSNPLIETININTYRNAVNKVFFFPNDYNIGVYKKYNDKINRLYNSWWEAIKTSKNIEKAEKILKNYRTTLKENDLVLLGCITEGGQGLATANNGKYVAIRKSTKLAKNVIESRPKKLEEAVKKENITELLNVINFKDYLNKLSEKEISDLFDKLKEKYGRDIFGQGYIFKLIEDNEIADVENLTDLEKSDGISTDKPYYVPYDKGDKDGNRWYLETPYAIAWTKKNVKTLQIDPKARWQGYNYFFKTGFCWGNVLNPHAKLLKTKLKEKTVNDVGSMSLNSVCNIVPNYYIVALLNSTAIFEYYRNYINNTVNIQINDIRQVPIIIPSEVILQKFKEQFDSAYEIKQQQFKGTITEQYALEKLKPIEGEIDLMVYKLYDLTYSEVQTIDPDFSMSEEDYNRYKF